MKSELEWMPIKGIKPYEKNPRKNDCAVDAVANSIEEFGFQNPIIVDKDMTIIAGHTRWKAAKKLGMKEVPVIIASELTEDQAKAFRLVDNRSNELAGWDWEMLIDEMDNIELDLSEMGFTLTDDGDVDFEKLEELAGEKDKNYEAFVDKFKPKHTTDDCFTPPAVYDAVKSWVVKHYGLTDDVMIVRPFYPGGNYQEASYPDGCLVLDNPPFSIMAEIVKFYTEKCVSFFLFAQSTTLFQHISFINAVLIGSSITYENGASVPTGFITNLGNSKVTISAELSKLLSEAQPSEAAEVGAYDWPDNVISGALTGRLAKFGTNMDIKKVVARKTVGESKQAIFGGGGTRERCSCREAESREAESREAESREGKGADHPDCRGTQGHSRAGGARMTFDSDDDLDTCALDEYFDDLDEDSLGIPRPRKPKAKPEVASTEDELKARAVKSKQRSVMRRALSEQHMNEVLDWHLEDGCAYHVISAGDVDFMTYMRGIVKQHPLDYLLCSTWCMAMEDAQEIGVWLKRGMVNRCDVYVGEIFIQHYMAIFEFLADLLPEFGGRLCMQRNHAKVMVGYWHGDDGTVHGVAVTSSANINTNPRIEQAVITVDKAVADFYKDFFDGLKPKNPWPIPWKPFEVS